MKILFITHYFYPDPNIFYGLPFARELVRRGHEVQVLTSFPNYLDNERFGYKQRPLLRETIDGVEIVRVPLYASHDSSALKRSLCYITYAFSSALWGLWFVKKADVVYLPQGPITAALAGVLLQMFGKTPFVLNIQDVWPDSVASTGMTNNKFILNMLDKWCKLVYKSATKISVISPGAKEKLIERGVASEKIELVYNWCDEKYFLKEGRDDTELAGSLGMSGTFNIVYTGNLGPAQNLEVVLDAAGTLKKSCPQVRFLLVGSGNDRDKLKLKAKEEGLTNVIFHDRVSLDDISRFISIADLLFVHLRDEPLFRFTMPSKIQTYMASGKAILAGLRGDPAELIESAGVGFTFLPGNSDGLVAAVEAACSISRAELDLYGKRAKEFYISNMSFSNGVGRYLALFENAVS
jgi:glycosyltransferase involved in cell wall biosynthesis